MRKNNAFLLSYFLIIVVILFVGLSCKGDFITGASIDNNYNVQSIQSNSEEENQYPEDTYYIVYTPFTGGTNLTRISYLDTNTLNEMWKKTIRHGLNGDGRAWGIRDADNVHYDIRNGNYYYFDKNFDIVHTGNYGNRVKVKKFLGAIIVDYSSNPNEGKGNWWKPVAPGGQSSPGGGGMAHIYNILAGLTGPVSAVLKSKIINPESRGVGVSTIVGTTLGYCPIEADANMMGTWSIGGLYESELNYSGPSFYEKKMQEKGYSDYGKYFIDFMDAGYRSGYKWGQGTLSVVVINVGYSKNEHTEFGFDQYYSTDVFYRQNIAYNAKDNFFGKDPQIYTRKLNVRVNHSYYGGQPDEYTGYISHMRFVSHWYPFDWQINN